MTDSVQPGSSPEHVRDSVRRGSGWLVVLGILSVILGVLAINAPLMTGVAVTLVVGWYLIAKGILELFAMFKAKGLGCGILAFIGGVLSVAAGIVILFCPVTGLKLLTLVLAVYFLLDGVTRIIVAFKARPLAGWAWHLFGGVLALGLGLMIWRQWPLSAIWAIGVFAGIHIMFSGWTQVFIGLAARRGAREGGTAFASA